MKEQQTSSVSQNILLFIGTFAAAIGISYLLSKVFADNNPFAVPLFILAVALIARFTDGYLYGIVASVVGVFCVNYMFTYPFWKFDLSIESYPMTFAVMLIVSVIISALTTQIKRQERLRYEIETEKMRADLLRSISHDIRTPLASIIGASGALLDNQEISSEDRREMLTSIQKEARWLIRITENILSITKFSTTGVRLKKSDEIVEEIVSSAIVKFRKNSESIRISVKKPEEILIVPMDATLIEQVIINLLENVSSHAKGADLIRVSVNKEEDKVIFSVADNGIGIPEKALPHLFDGRASMYLRPSDGHRSMGIGLSVCSSIVRAHGGEMSAYNNEEGGVTIVFWLPCDKEETIDADER